MSLESIAKTLTDSLKLKDVLLVGHSTGGGEVVRYIGRHGNRLQDHIKRQLAERALCYAVTCRFSRTV